MGKEIKQTCTYIAKLLDMIVSILELWYIVSLGSSKLPEIADTIVIVKIVMNQKKPAISTHWKKFNFDFSQERFRESITVLSSKIAK